MKRILKFVRFNGHAPFDDWIDRLDTASRAQIRSYIDRVALGGAKLNTKRLRDGSGVCEIKINSGPGFRVYYVEIEQESILLLLGGEKKSQKRDIERAKLFWRQFHAKTHDVR